MFAEEKRNDALLKSTAERNVKNEWRAPSQKNTTLIYSVSFVVVLIIAIGAYTFIHIKAQAAALEAARLQAEAIKAATKAQENAAAINAAASVVNTVVNAAVEANKPAPVIINNK